VRKLSIVMSCRILTLPQHLPRPPTPDLGQVDIFDPDLSNAPNNWYFDEEPDYESDSGSEFWFESESESDAVVTGK